MGNSRQVEERKVNEEIAFPSRKKLSFAGSWMLALAAYAAGEYFLAARSMLEPALLRSLGTITAWNSTSALNARNQGSATAGIWEASCMSKMINAVRLPWSSVK